MIEYRDFQNSLSAFFLCIADMLELREADDGPRFAVGSVLAFGPIPPLLASVCCLHTEVTEGGLVETAKLSGEHFGVSHCHLSARFSR